MKKLAVLGALLPLILLTSSIASAFDLSKVHNLVVFGDSLSDNGNTYVAAGLPKPPYYHGRWTMGITWVDYFTRTTETWLRPLRMSPLLRAFLAFAASISQLRD
jgi:phospholipase/lecithinase/hemolysin